VSQDAQTQAVLKLLMQQDDSQFQINSNPKFRKKQHILNLLQKCDRIYRI